MGRTKETAQLRRALERGHNVVVLGKYGIGRTSLIRHLADLTRDRWRFVFADFSQTPGQVCNELLAGLFPEQKQARYTRYKSGRFKILHRDLGDDRNHVIVLDNIAKLSPQRLNLIRYFVREERFRLIAIVEPFVPRSDLFLLRAILSPVSVITLGYLTFHNAVELFHYYSQKYRLDWPESRIDFLARSTGGYALGMVEVVVRETRRCYV